MKPTLYTLLYYAISISAIAALNRLSPSSPCTPGLGLMAFLMVILATLVLLIFSIYKTSVADKRYLLPIFLHLLAIGIFFLNG